MVYDLRIDLERHTVVLFGPDHKSHKVRDLVLNMGDSVVVKSEVTLFDGTEMDIPPYKLNVTYESANLTMEVVKGKLFTCSNKRERFVYGVDVNYKYPEYDVSYVYRPDR